MPTLYYCDPGLMSQLGHHAATCREVTTAFRGAGWDVQVFLHVNTEPDLLAEFQAQAHFRAFTYGSFSKDPFAGFLLSYETGAAATLDDLKRLPAMTAEDVVFWNTCSNFQLSALGSWQQGKYTPESSPTLFVEFGKHPGWTEGKPLQSVEPGLYRYGGLRVMPLFKDSFHCLTFDAGMARTYSQILDRPVHAVSAARSAGSVRARSAAETPLTVGVVGHQRPCKGFQLMPEICRRLFASGRDVHVLAHNGEEKARDPATQELLRMADDDVRMTVIRKTADADTWDRLFDAIDVMVLPYDPDTYRTNYSAVEVEALFRGIPCVVPANTALSALLDENGMPGTTFDAWQAEAVTDAVVRALDDFDGLAEKARATAAVWAEEKGTKKMLAELMALRDKRKVLA